MKIGKNEFCLGVVIALIALSSIPQLCSAALVWSETFDAIDPGIWTINYGELEDGCVRGTVGHGVSLYRNSTVTAGTWKLELRKMNDWSVIPAYDVCRVYFMSSGGVISLPDAYLALSLKQIYTGEEESITYSIDKYLNGVHSYPATYTGEARETAIGVLHRFAISRTSEGLISVFLNDTLILQATDTDITATQYFGFYTFDDWALDNIEVDDTPIGGLPWVLIAVGVGIPVVLVAAVLLMKRR